MSVGEHWSVTWKPGEDILLTVSEVDSNLWQVLLCYVKFSSKILQTHYGVEENHDSNGNGNVAKQKV